MHTGQHAAAVHEHGGRAAGTAGQRDQDGEYADAQSGGHHRLHGDGGQHRCGAGQRHAGVRSDRDRSGVLFDDVRGVRRGDMSERGGPVQRCVERDDRDLAGRRQCGLHDHRDGQRSAEWGSDEYRQRDAADGWIVHAEQHAASVHGHDDKLAAEHLRSAVHQQGRDARRCANTVVDDRGRQQSQPGGAESGNTRSDAGEHDLRKRYPDVYDVWFIDHQQVRLRCSEQPHRGGRADAIGLRRRQWRSGTEPAVHRVPGAIRKGPGRSDEHGLGLLGSAEQHEQRDGVRTGGTGHGSVHAAGAGGAVADRLELDALADGHHAGVPRDRRVARQAMSIRPDG